MWSQDWGTMIWSGGVGVPGLQPVGFLVLSGLLLLLGGALARRRHGPRWMGLVLAVIAVPTAWPAVALGPLPFSFQNGTVADADEVNQNLEVLRAALTAVEDLHVVYQAKQASTINILANSSDVSIISLDLPAGRYLVQLTAGARAQVGGFCQLRVASFPPQQLDFRPASSTISPNFVPQQEVSAATTIAMQSAVDLEIADTVEMVCTTTSPSSFASHPLSISRATLVARPVLEIIDSL